VFAMSWLIPGFFFDMWATGSLLEAWSSVSDCCGARGHWTFAENAVPCVVVGQ